MNIDDIELKLIGGFPINIDECGDVYTPTVKRVIEIGETKYNQHLSLLLLDKNNIDRKFDDEIDIFDIIFSYCYHNEQFRTEYLSALQFVFQKEAYLCDVSTSSDAFFVFEDQCILHKENFRLLQDVVRIGNHVKIVKQDEDEYNPADDLTAKVIAEMLERRKKKPKPKPAMNLQSMISGLGWKSGSPNIESVINLTMYQFYDGFKRMEQLDSIHYTLFGVYTGNVDSKKLNFKELSFAKILDK